MRELGYREEKRRRELGYRGKNGVELGYIGEEEEGVRLKEEEEVG